MGRTLSVCSVSQGDNQELEKNVQSLKFHFSLCYQN